MRSYCEDHTKLVKGCEPCRLARNAYKKWHEEFCAQRLAADPSLAPHGVYSTYSNWRCRCKACRNAWAEYCRGAREVRVLRLAAGDVDVPHGVYTTYINYGCRCGECVRANSAYRKSVAA